MDKTEVLGILNRFEAALTDLGVASPRIVLYGSQADGTAREHSDIDVVVIAPSFNGMSFWERIDVLTKAICKTSVRIEAVAMTPDEWERRDSLVAEFARQGEVVVG